MLTKKGLFNHIQKYFYDREILITREMTKIHEEYIREKVKNLNNVECFNFGLGSKDEIKTLYKSQGNYGKSSSVLSPKLHLEALQVLHKNYNF